MEKNFYISHEGGWSGPFDTLAMLRKIRSGSVTAYTLVSPDAALQPMPACSFPELTTFLHQSAPDQAVEHVKPLTAMRIFGRMLDTGWKMVVVEPNLCVIAGGLIIVLFISATVLFRFLGTTGGFIGEFFLLCSLQNFFVAITLRLHRSQRLSPQYLQSTLTPALFPLILGALVAGALILPGLCAFILPGLLMMTFLSMMPFYIMDRKKSVISALCCSFKHIYGLGYSRVVALLLLQSLYTLGIVLVLPFPLLLPVYAAALAEIYDTAV